jgi:methyl acetate hydrolase
MTLSPTQTLREAGDAVLDAAVRADAPVAGVVAMVTDREATLYEGAAGVRRYGGDTPMTPDTVFALFSTTKAVTATAALQLVEDDRLDLDAPAARYVPELGELQVLDGFGDDGAPRLRPPRREITTRMLLTHTAGLGYDFSNEHYHRLATEHGQPSVITGTRACLRTPLLFDPGERWEYGSGVDWAGQVVEGVTGERLGDVVAARVLEPLGMRDTTFTLDDRLRARAASMHARGADGSLTPLDGWELPPDPEVHMGGHGLYGTVGDYLRFIRMWLGDGRGEHGRVLRPETVEAAVQNQLGDLQVTALPGVDRALTNDAEFFPGVRKSWSLAFMVNDEPAPTGRPAGAQGWAGLGNLFYWLDRETGVGGFWATQVLPFGDATSFGGYLELETAVYRSLTGADGASGARP